MVADPRSPTRGLPGLTAEPTWMPANRLPAQGFTWTPGNAGLLPCADLKPASLTQALTSLTSQGWGISARHIWTLSPGVSEGCRGGRRWIPCGPQSPVSSP